MLRIDDSVKLAGQVLAAHMQTSAVPQERLRPLLNEIHSMIIEVQQGTYATWVDELPDLDVLDAQAEQVGKAGFRPPRHPAASITMTYEDKVAATVHDDRIECLECGRDNLKLIAIHLRDTHDMTWDQYRARHGLRADYPTAPRNYVERKRRSAEEAHRKLKDDANAKKEADAK